MRGYLKRTPVIEALLTVMRRAKRTDEARSWSVSVAARGGIWGLLVFALLAVPLAIQPSLLQASDHADPTALNERESNITGLFFFPEGDQMILVLNIVRSLRNPKPYNLEPFEYTINMDLKTPVSFTDPANLARFGGTVDRPEDIHSDVAIKIHLKNDVTLKDISFGGLTGTDSIRKFIGVRDDPFVFPRFFKKNVISMVLSVPKTSFPAGQHDFILWATVFKDGKQVDHVGRSIRTQLPRLGLLNTLPPSEQVKALMKQKDRTEWLFNFLRGNREWWSKAFADILQFTFLIRKYDVVPDVMIYSDRFPPGFPNGRRLDDDVVAQVCATDDCLLQEISFMEGDWPRATKNDKPFLADWPYVGEPWADEQEAAAATRSIWPYLIGALLVLALIFWGLVEIVRRVILWLWRRLRPRPAVAA